MRPTRGPPAWPGHSVYSPSAWPPSPRTVRPCDWTPWPRRSPPSSRPPANSPSAPGWPSPRSAPHRTWTRAGCRSLPQCASSWLVWKPTSWPRRPISAAARRSPHGPTNQPTRGSRTAPTNAGSWSATPPAWARRRRPVGRGRPRPVQRSGPGRRPDHRCRVRVRRAGRARPAGHPAGRAARHGRRPDPGHLSRSWPRPASWPRPGWPGPVDLDEQFWGCLPTALLPATGSMPSRSRSPPGAAVMIFDVVLRLEADPNQTDLARGLAAEVADPAWFLGRQWQMGEHQGEDASSPVSVDLPRSLGRRSSRSPGSRCSTRPWCRPRRSSNPSRTTGGRRAGASRIGRQVAAAPRGRLPLPRPDPAAGRAARPVRRPQRHRSGRAAAVAASCRPAPGRGLVRPGPARRPASPSTSGTAPSSPTRRRSPRATPR